jgi:hypothetical protein
MSRITLYIWAKIRDLYDRFQALFIFLLVLLLIILADTLINSFMTFDQIPFNEVFDVVKRQTSIDFAPEVWLSALSLVLGTLVIVISIASQSTPKLIDLYIKDEISLLYIWFLTISAAHVLWLQYIASSGIILREPSVFLNTYILLPVALLLSIPYIFYILKYTKPNNVISKIHLESKRRIRRLKYSSAHVLLSNKAYSERYQVRMFESLNQLDDLLEYVEFKEPKGDILRKMGDLVQTYIGVKKFLPDNFFEISARIRSDISFKTMTGQFEQIESSKTFFEQKAYRLMGNAYFNLMSNNHYDLASLSVNELYLCGKKAIEANDTELIRSTIIRLNTFLRLAIKHGLSNSEARNIYNAMLHYSSFIYELIKHRKIDFIRQSCFYLKIYGTEIYRHSRRDPIFTFLVDVFAWELKKILISLHENDYTEEIQKAILGMLLEMDSPPDVDRDEIGQTRIINDGVRVLQVGLALYYLREDKRPFAEMIVEDILDDYKVLGKDLRKAVESPCNKLKIFTPDFWEDTDRGNQNLYYSPDKEQIEPFLALFDELFANFLKEIDAGNFNKGKK